MTVSDELSGMRVVLFNNEAPVTVGLGHRDNAWWSGQGGLRFELVPRVEVKGCEEVALW